jgi:quinol monooxygenase YgiN
MRSFILISALVLGFAATATPANAKGVRMFVRHEVSDYAAWRKTYDAFDATRRKMGVTAQAVYQSTDNPNDVTAYHDFKNVERAKAFAASAELKSAMQKAGVKGAPQIWFTTATPGSSGNASHVRMFVRHEVSDYATWRKAYDDFDATRWKMGVTGQSVYQSTDNPNDVTAYHDFKSVEQAKAFAASAELKSAMQQAGVKGVPQIWFTIKAGN